MKHFKIDINADVGEGIGNEAQLMPFVSSCNIACGGHAGDLQTMKTVVKLAKLNGVKIGAHPSFPDKLNFGRVIMKLSDDELFESLKSQIENLQSVLKSEGLKLNHIKPHGALYNLAAKDLETANVIVRVFKCLNVPIKLYAPYNSVLADLAIKEHIEVEFEAFADRNYNDDLSLVSRKNTNAIVHKKEAVLSHVLGVIKHQKINTINGVEVPIKASTICVHGDTKNALEILQFLHRNLTEQNIKIQ
ncbi:5-oxoprolinase subunit PxpA [Winogradskyella endarachnes]|uniref:5-oxoprolinase subunit PxpA n=1 Tax=Winogradskyella endarachnes TaxID=2681965 RepID=A0A6L6U4H5_9FLAO|nr:5-oxoprolinase subunit PxpA [Winogradskyella endarachnes]MUU76941.1 5-oxoprolinase subunit PxpA [Winogradskyella endarachnes]